MGVKVWGLIFIAVPLNLRLLSEIPSDQLTTPFVSEARRVPLLTRVAELESGFIPKRAAPLQLQ
jgi:hypothetical protein